MKSAVDFGGSALEEALGEPVVKKTTTNKKVTEEAEYLKDDEVEW
jgi:hypothetical protein